MRNQWVTRGPNALRSFAQHVSSAVGYLRRAAQSVEEAPVPKLAPEKEEIPPPPCFAVSCDSPAALHYTRGMQISVTFEGDAHMLDYLTDAQIVEMKEALWNALLSGARAKSSWYCQK